MQATNHPSKSVKIGITHGDFNGVSYEIILKTFADARILQMMTPILYGQSKVLSYYKKSLGVEEFNYSLTRDVRQAWPQKFNIVNITDDELKIEPGFATEQAGNMAVLSLKRAVDDLVKGNIDALVTAPVNPAILRSDRFDFKGQSDYLSSLFDNQDYLEMLVSDYIRIPVHFSSLIPRMLTFTLAISCLTTSNLP